MSFAAVPLKTATFQPSEPQRFIQIDEDGYFSSDGLRIADAEAGRAWLAALQQYEMRVWTRIENVDVIVEAFDAPYVALQIDHENDAWRVTMPYGHRENFSLETLSLDEWDRFHGRTERGIPFVLSRAAQASFFDGLDEYSDDWIEAGGVKYDIAPWLTPVSPSDRPDYWTNRYQQGQTGWDLAGPHPSLPRFASAVKIQRSRILILGCGRGHDAAWFARAGHIVTAFDYSEEALREARALYGDVTDLTFVQGDAFALPAKYDQQFDVVFDHTMYCAIDPTRRNDLVRVWRRALTENGHLLAIFFCSEKKNGPPYGGSEWELRARFEKQFRPLYWQRIKDSPPNRLGEELFVYSQKLATLR